MNKRVCCLIAGVSCMIGSAYAQAVAIYQVTDMAGQSENQILNKEEAAKLDTEIKEEAKVFPAIMATAKKEWAADKENKAPFPAARIKLRTVKKLGSDFPSQEAAAKKVEQLDLRTAEKITQEAKEKTSGKNKKQKPNPEEVAKETLRNTLANNAISDVNRRMAEKLGREVPMFGFMSSTPVKKEEKKEVKKDAKKDIKKDAEKK